MNMGSIGSYIKKEIWVKKTFTYLTTNVAQHYHIMVKELQIHDKGPISEIIGLILMALNLIYGNIE